VTLVPIPRCIPSAPECWPAWQVANALRTLGLAGALWVGLERGQAVRKSATSPAGARPTARQHFESLVVTRASCAPPEKIVLVDDVITKGRTLFAAAARLREFLPRADLRAFALVRSQGFLGHVVRLLDPCEGWLRWAGGDVWRDP
jgi:adenine/guanine phosphoribosyltransferase-like PRPP-binding protein